MERSLYCATCQPKLASQSKQVGDERSGQITENPVHAEDSGGGGEVIAGNDSGVGGGSGAACGDR